MPVQHDHWTRPASSGQEDIFSQLWIPENPKAILQIAHGMAEYGGRYDRFARHLASHGYVVCANDHAGHGLYAKTKGFFAEKDGWAHLLNDMKGLMDQVLDRYPQLPCFLFGHSMGSFLSRSYVVRFDGIQGMILSGTAGTTSGLKVGRVIAAIQKKCKGARSKGRLLTTLTFGTANKKIKNPSDPYAWLSRDDSIVDAYQTDNYCGFIFTAAGYYDLFTGMIEVTAEDWAAKVPTNISALIISGDSDPIGAYGRGPTEVSRQLQDTGHEDVTLKLYADGRHEMLNEANREEVFADVLAWLEVQNGI